MNVKDDMFWPFPTWHMSACIELAQNLKQKSKSSNFRKLIFSCLKASKRAQRLSILFNQKNCLDYFYNWILRDEYLKYIRPINVKDKQRGSKVFKPMESISLIVWKLCAFRQRRNFGNYQQFFHHNFRLKWKFWILGNI